MRLTKDYVKLHQNEDNEIIRCVCWGFMVSDMPGQIKNLQTVWRFFVQNNLELKVDTFSYFSNVIGELGIDPPTLETHPIDPGKGGCYAIPKKEGARKRKRLFLRAKNRRTAVVRMYEDLYWQNQLQKIPTGLVERLPNWVSFSKQYPNLAHPDGMDMLGRIIIDTSNLSPDDSGLQLVVSNADQNSGT